MAKKHKHADNGLALNTALSVADLRAICAQAAVESTGDLWNGTQKIVEIDSGDAWIAYVIQGSVTGWNKFMTFTVTLGADGARSTLKTEIASYSTSQTTLMYFIPVSPKKMRARHTYLQFVNKVANTVRDADGSARIALSEGDWMAPAAVPMASAVPAAASAPTPPPPPPPAAAAVAPPPPPPAVDTPSGAPAPDEIDERTRKVTRPEISRQWTVSPEGMAPVMVTTSVTIGRQPSSDDGPSITVPRGEDTVSKRHAVVELIGEVIHVTDLGSANGTVLVGPHEQVVECPPHVRTPIPAGFSLELGDFPVRVDNSGGPE